MEHYRHVKDVNDIEQFGDEVYFITPARHCGYTLAQKIYMDTMQSLGKNCVMLKATKETPVPFNEKFTLSKEEQDNYFDRVLDFYDKLFKYTIDGKEVSAKEFYEHVRIIDRENEKGDEYWYVQDVAQEDVH